MFMKIMKISIVLLLFFCWGGTNVWAGSLPKQFQLIPLPREIEVLKGKGINMHEISFVIAADTARIPVLGELLDALPRTKRAGKGVVLSLSEQYTPESSEGYVLKVATEKIEITARTQVGLFYGCQTLEQLMEDSRDSHTPIPQLRITDYPEITYRAVHLDTKHHLDRTEYYYRVIDKLARYKINAIIWELEDKLRYTRRPEVGAPNAISKQEMQAICRYAKERCIEISPLVQGLGHAGFILKHHWKLRENQQSDWEFCPSDPRTYDLQFDLYRDAMEAMPGSKYLHVGGDEITAIGIDERCQATGKTAFELQMEWLRKVCDFAIAHGKTPVFWDDMPLKYSGIWSLLHQRVSDEEIRKRWDTERLDEAIQMFPKDCVYMRWHYEDPTALSHRLLLQWYQQHGLKVMGATAASMGATPFMPRNNSRAQYIRDFSQLVAENQLSGIFATAWDDGSPHLETVMRGFIAQGEFGWYPGGRNVSEFIEAHALREFGLSFSQMAFLTELEKSAFFFDGALVTSGSRNPAWGVTTSFRLIDLPDVKVPGKWSEKYQKKLDAAHLESVRYDEICEGLKIAQSEALRNRYTLDVYEQTNQLFNYPVRLLVALEAFDKAKNKEEHRLALTQIKILCNYFKEMRFQLEEVYSQTRFMQNPDGYIADQNHHHHLSALTNSSNWLYLYEIPMVQKIERWLKAYNSDVFQ